jgi:hypothetical protein
MREKREKKIAELEVAIDQLSLKAENAWFTVQREEYLKQLKILGETRNRLLKGD